jgi:hypothetical protein
MRACSFLAALALFACAPATRSVSTAPAVAPVTAPAGAEQAAPRRHRHLARLTPPFAAASGTRRVADDGVVTAFASAP